MFFSGVTKLQPAPRLCPGNATRLLTVQRRTVGLLDVKTQQFEALQTLRFDPVALTFDLTRGRYYWADGQGVVYGSDGRSSWTLFTGRFLQKMDVSGS